MTVNAKRRGKRQVLIRPSSKVVVKFLSVMQRHGEHFLFNIFLGRLPRFLLYASLVSSLRKIKVPLVSVQPYSVCSILTMNMRSQRYIGEFEIVDNHRSNKINIQLNGRLNKIGVISPRLNIQHSQIESWVNLLLPARGFGIIIPVCPPLFLCVFVF